MFSSVAVNAGGGWLVGGSCSINAGANKFGRALGLDGPSTGVLELDGAGATADSASTSACDPPFPCMSDNPSFKCTGTTDVVKGIFFTIDFRRERNPSDRNSLEDRSFDATFSNLSGATA